MNTFEWPIAPICDRQLRDINKEDLIGLMKMDIISIVDATHTRAVEDMIDLNLYGEVGMIIMYGVGTNL